MTLWTYLAADRKWTLLTKTQRSVMMPDVFETGGYIGRMYKHDPPPPHVYVWSAHGIARVSLGRTEEEVRVLHATGMEEWEKARIEMIVRAYLSRLLRKWEALHGSKD